jgi:hypothetical protein
MDHGAKWCTDHDRWECTKNRTKGRGPCHNVPVSGTNACTSHSGKKIAVAKLEGAAKIQAHRNAQITAWNPAGETPTVDHQAVALSTLQMSWLRLAMYAELVRRQVAAEGDAPLPEPDDADSLELDDDGEIRLPKAKISGLIGYEYGAAGKEGRIFAKSEQVRALVRLESEERDRVMRYTKQCHDMGISDRLTTMAEKWGDIVANRVTKLLVALNLSPEQAAMAPELITRYLGVIDLASPEKP